MQTQAQEITCKAAVAFAANEPMKVVDIRVGAPKAGEVRVKVIANALCHTDVYTLSGQDAEGKFPSILGHEATAVVESVGEGVTDYKVGDLVVPCYTPQCGEWDCIYCQSEKTNLCPKVRAFQGAGVMPDGTSRFSTLEGEVIYHFMGCSTFSEYTVLNAISLAKINPAADPYQACLLGCGVSTGWGCVMNNPNFKAGVSVAVWGLGAVGLAVIQAAKLRGATRIYGLDINKGKFEIAKKFGATDCHNPMESSSKEWLLEHEKWGIEFTFDCTGNVMVMREALEVAHRGYGESTVVGVAAAGKELATRPFQLVTGRVWKGTAFGGWKSRQDVPKLTNKVLLNEYPIKDYITHNFTGLEKVQELLDALHSGDCLRGVLRISDWDVPSADNIPKVIKSSKLFGGVLKTVQHFSQANQCVMTFSIFLPEDDVHRQRTDAWPALYYLSGLTCNHENAVMKSGFAPHAKRNNLVMVFPDTSPRDVDIEKAGNEDWQLGYGAGHYVDATNKPWSKHFNMYTYVTEELPRVVEAYFHVDPTRKSITGHSMGGNGALMVAARNPTVYKSLSAFAPISDPKSGFSDDAYHYYFSDVEEAKPFIAVEVINKAGSALTLPPTLVDQGTKDEWTHWLGAEHLRTAFGSNGHKNATFRYQDGYDHGFNFVSTFLPEHIDFHAKHLK